MKSQNTSIVFLFTMCFITFINYAQVQIGTNLYGNDVNEQFGYSVALSNNGNVLAVSGIGLKNDTGLSSGGVRIYQNNSGTWTPIGSDIQGESENEANGFKIALTGDGNTIIIGSPGYTQTNGLETGRVRVFNNQSGNWVQVGQDILGKNAGDAFGLHVDISEDGRIISLGSIFDDEIAENAGSVKVYEIIGNDWIQLGQSIDGISADDRTSNHSLSSNGDVLAVTSNGNNGEEIGIVRVYELDLLFNEWTQIGQTLIGETKSSSFGANGMDLSEDGMILAIAAPFANTNAVGVTRVLEFNRSLAEWEQIGSDIVGDIGVGTLGNGFGLSLSSNGQKLAVGIPGDASDNDLFNFSRGSIARIYENQSNNWVQIGEDMLSDNIKDHFGWSIALSDNDIVAIGGFSSDFNGVDSGVVSVYDVSPSTLNIVDFNTSVINIDAYPNPVSNILNIKLDNQTILSSIDLYNSMGQQIATFDRNKIDVSGFSKGLYFVKISTNQGNTTKRVIFK
ncbi:hypothetical protein A8C32_18615 [Flavivirga aquatica]|uniref:Secretion system C-terminal sorting domain-containing protein n=1 Tax=Flavivirga aquatica TaxID=1849968 RepID=A0A1E5T3U2_9FLAO|nr:T9SS type A sorting domain-containing protein [Flavivirga aquatica]OEK06049.1 hypothetical protein A8C32_18615 [Flavivirga aquatica]